MALFLTLLYTFTIILSPIASKYLIDKVLKSKDYSEITIGIFIFFIACVSQSIVSFFKDIVFSNNTISLNLDISEKMFNKVLTSPINFFDKNNSGQIISRIINDGKTLGQFITNFFIIFIKNILLTIIIIICMILISIKITSIVLLLFILFFLLSNIVGKKFDIISNNIALNNDSMYSFVNQVVDSIDMVKSFGIEESIKLKYKNILDKSKVDLKKREILSIILKNSSSTIVTICLSLIYGLGTLEIIKGHMTLGDIVGLGLYFQLLIQPVYELINNTIDINSIKPILNRVNDYLNLEEEFFDNTKDFYISKLSVENLYFSYDGIDNILSNINIDFPQKGIVAISGESGCGKSTLVKLLLKFYIPNMGSIKINSLDYCNISVNAIRKNFSFVPQDVKLFNSSIMNNFKQVNPKISKNTVINICKKLNLHEKIIDLKDQYDTIITEKINFSGGEKQRLGIGLALAKDSPILILDEPTSALDKLNESKIVNILKTLSKEKLIIIISHKTNTLKIADKVYFLKK
ncbi:ABC transporter ATP-binding protein [Clostridium novyi]|uniref:ABC transporter ATP-binding protein n=1 Tax=Clostridium novyi TaxID=1542 RepID=UPI001650E283|nr:ABC transporter ATP-binding protein [Clostridium novyi]